MTSRDSCRCHLTRTDGSEWLVTELHLGEGGPFVTARRLADGQERAPEARNGASRGGTLENGSRSNGPPHGASRNGTQGDVSRNGTQGDVSPTGSLANGGLHREPLSAGDRLEWVSDDGVVRWAMRIPVGLGEGEESLRKPA